MRFRVCPILETPALHASAYRSLHERPRRRSRVDAGVNGALTWHPWFLDAGLMAAGRLPGRRPPAHDLRAAAASSSPAH